MTFLEFKLPSALRKYKQIRYLRPVITTDKSMAKAEITPIPATQVKPLHLPFFDLKVVAGFPIPLNNDEMAQDVELLRLLCPNPDSSYLIRVQGDSMVDAGIHSDDILVVDKSLRNPTESQVALCELNGEYTIKHVVSREGRGWLMPANPAYPPIEVTAADDFSVWGTVTYIIHRPGK